jgi:hypothetical protein
MPPACTADDDCTGSRVCDLDLGGHCRLPDPSETDCVAPSPIRTPLTKARARRRARARAPAAARRLSATAREEGTDAVWEPRLWARPVGDFGAWAMDKPTRRSSFPTSHPRAATASARPRPAPRSTPTIPAAARGAVLATGGVDPYPLSHPASHRCLEDLTCPSPPPP